MKLLLPTLTSAVIQSSHFTELHMSSYVVEKVIQKRSIELKNSESQHVESNNKNTTNITVLYYFQRKLNWLLFAIDTKCPQLMSV